MSIFKIEEDCEYEFNILDGEYGFSEYTSVGKLYRPNLWFVF